MDRYLTITLRVNDNTKVNPILDILETTPGVRTT